MPKLLRAGFVCSALLAPALVAQQMGPLRAGVAKVTSLFHARCCRFTRIQTLAAVHDPLFARALGLVIPKVWLQKGQERDARRQRPEHFAQEGAANLAKNGQGQSTELHLLPFLSRSGAPA